MTATKPDPLDMTETEIIHVIEQTSAAIAVAAPAKAKRLRDRAEECRALAQIMTSVDDAAYYANLAETYECLAEQHEQLARDIVTFNINTSA